MNLGGTPLLPREIQRTVATRPNKSSQIPDKELSSASFKCLMGIPLVDLQLPVTVLRSLAQGHDEVRTDCDAMTVCKCYTNNGRPGTAFDLFVDQMDGLVGWDWTGNFQKENTRNN